LIVISRNAFSLIILFSAGACSFGALKPEEIVIVAARGNRESEGLAKYYARVRSVPEANVCLVDMSSNELLPHEMWQWGVRPEIRKWFTEHDPEQKIRCIVTVWGVPLKIGPAEASDQSRRYRQFLESERSHRLELLRLVERTLGQVAPKGDSGDEVPGTLDVSSTNDTNGEDAADILPGASANPDASKGDKPADGPNSELKQQQARLESALQGAQGRLAKLAAGEPRNQGQMQLQQLAAAAGGANVILQGLNQQITANPNLPATARSEFDVLRGRAAAYAEVRLLLDQSPPSIERDAMVMAVLERLGGLLATVEWLDEQLKVVSQNETGASFDSELALVMWPDDYQLLRWQPNYLRPAFENSQLPKANRTLMVARLDAPTLALAKGLVDTAIKVEKEGLRGKVYIDTRGIGKLEDQNVVPGGYGDYDRALLITAKGIDDQTDLEVVLDTSPQLFQPGTCPDAAVYCGWYSLAKYVDAFDWKPGAVAYHLASNEAHSLRDPASQAWCKKLLEDGVCATIGPVYEPYLGSFPRPNEFFGMLLQGDLTLVECYARSNPFNSWMMTLIGDPLYRPFKYRVPAQSPTDAGTSPGGQGPIAPTLPPASSGNG
jgi:uncharacterized protein (TIGR03790 family)